MAVWIGSHALTMTELLVLLGRAWSRLLLYPGGVSAFALIWLIKYLQPRIVPSFLRHSLHLQPTSSTYVPVSQPLHTFASMSAVVLPWLALSLLPLPLAPAMERPIDVLVVVALLDWPLILTIAIEVRQRGWSVQQNSWRRLAAALNGYPSFMLAMLLLVMASRSLQLDQLTRLPGADTVPAILVAWALGVCTLVVSLPPLLGLGPFATDAPEDVGLRIGLRLRGIGLVVLAIFPLLGLLESYLWLFLLLCVCITGYLILFIRLAGRWSAQQWAIGYALLALVQLAVLLGVSVVVLQDRL
ncbi:MAG: hypothetical protein GFH27_549323n47 [Chloroflexi bacterium AL-W]|nr:hypothetical protein [Chloroflexi bacterium AL-N1]NOK70198.1 hypothetical protein [Chloroflexi bacterium AL-N10]NOK77735.1 hypothetical protein [Chloroflexi bacterium AL-N5]NOK84744.1 hypothetical protein [Chloroflexi bacterium AL-W]NOK93193.1 hypothetical protein [Chloroflexi bacterium AL-N15]